MFRLVKVQIAWWWVRNHFTLLQHAADANDTKEWAKVLREIKSTRMWRGIVLAAEAIAVAVCAPIAWQTVPLEYLSAAGAAAVLGLAHYGRPAGRTILGTAVVAARFRKLNSDIVLRAYYAAGLGRPDRPDAEVRFGSPMSRDARNTGSQVVVDLPFGKGWSDVISAKEKIASGLDVHLNQVFLSPDKTSSAAGTPCSSRTGTPSPSRSGGPTCSTASHATSGSRSGSARTNAAAWSPCP